MRRILFIFSIFLLTASCVRMDEEMPATDLFPVKLSIKESVDTKSSLGVSNDGRISNLSIGVYLDGTKTYGKYYESTSGIILNLTLAKEYHIYAVANVGAVEFPDDESAVNQINVVWSPSTMASSGFPMAEYVEYTSKIGNPITLYLERLVSRYDLIIDRSCLDGTFTATGLQLKNSSAAINPFVRNFAATGVVDGDSASVNDLASLNDGTTVSFYMFENAQGTVKDITDPWEKTSDKVSGKKCTYIELQGTYSNHGLSQDMGYRFYLGQNNTTDFNVIRNNVKTITLTLSDEGTLKQSWKVIPGTVTDNRTISFSPASVSITGPGTGTVTLTTSPSGVRYELSKDGDFEDAGLSYADNKGTITLTASKTVSSAKTVNLIATTWDKRKSAILPVTVNPVEDHVTNYIISPITLDKNNVPASGGTVTVSGGKVTRIWLSGKEDKDYADATISVARTSENNLYPAIIDGNIITVNSLSTNVEFQGTYTVSASFAEGGISATAQTAQFTQGENKVENNNYDPKDYAATISIGSGLAASGGSATVTFGAYHNAKNLYTSGASDSNSHKEYDSATVTITVNGNGAFELSGSTTQTGENLTCTLNHNNMTTNVRTDNVTLTVVNNSMTSKTATDSKSISNALLDQHYKDMNGTVGENTEGSSTIKSYGTPTISIGDGLTAAGGSATVTASVKDVYTGNTVTSWYQKYTSGSWSDLKSSVNSGDYEQTGEVTLSITQNGNGRFSLSGSTLSHDNMTTKETTDNVTVKAVNKNSTSKSATASKSITNNRYPGTSYTKNHTLTGSPTFGDKTYGSKSYGNKSYGNPYVYYTNFGTTSQSETYGTWTTYSTGTDKFDYAVSFSETSWTPSDEASNKNNTVSAYHYEKAKTEQVRTITKNYEQSYTQYYYRDYTRTVSMPYTRSAKQKCNYIEYRTDTFDSGSTLYVEENKTHTEEWTDSGTEQMQNDTGSEYYTSNSGTEKWTEDGGYDYQTLYGDATKKTDTVTPVSSESWLSWANGKMSVTANSSSSSRTATLTATNGDVSASCTVTQAGVVVVNRYRIELSPAEATIYVNDKNNNTVTYTVRKYTDVYTNNVRTTEDTVGEVIANSNVTWSVSGDHVSINITTGLVTAKSIGDATVTATLKSDANVSGTALVHVDNTFNVNSGSGSENSGGGSY